MASPWNSEVSADEGEGAVGGAPKEHRKDWVMKFRSFRPHPTPLPPGWPDWMAGNGQMAGRLMLTRLPDDRRYSRQHKRIKKMLKDENCDKKFKRKGKYCGYFFHWGHVQQDCPWTGMSHVPCRVTFCPYLHPRSANPCPRFPDSIRNPKPGAKCGKRPGRRRRHH